MSDIGTFRCLVLIGRPAERRRFKFTARGGGQWGL
jgi:hypothetical protein